MRQCLCDDGDAMIDDGDAIIYQLSTELDSLSPVRAATIHMAIQADYTVMYIAVL